MLSVSNLVDYVSKLEVERDQLHQQLADVTESMGRVEERCAELRELCKQIRKTLDEVEGETDTCGHCDLFSECASKGWKECEFDRRMRELGVEIVKL